MQVLIWITSFFVIGLNTSNQVQQYVRSTKNSFMEYTHYKIGFINQNGNLCKISQAILYIIWPIYLSAVSAIAECYISTLPSTHMCVYIKYMRRSRSSGEVCVHDQPSTTFMRCIFQIKCNLQMYICMHIYQREMK